MLCDINNADFLQNRSLKFTDYQPDKTTSPSVQETCRSGILLFANHGGHGLGDKLCSGTENHLNTVITDEHYAAGAKAVQTVLINRFTFCHFQAQTGDAGADGVDV